MKRVHGAVAGMMALLLSGAAFAQGMYSGSTDANVDISKSYKASDLSGMSVHNRQDEKLGTISDLIIDKDGKVSNVVLREGWVAGLGQHYLVPWDRVQLTAGEKFAIIDVNRDQLSSEFAAVEETKADKEKNKEKDKKEGKSGKAEKAPEDGTGKPSATSPPSGAK